MIDRNVTSGLRLLIAIGLLFACGSSALAHKPSDSYLRINAGEETLSVEWDISIKDLDYVIGLDTDNNGEITWGEVKAQQSAIVEHALNRLSLTADGTPCDLRFTKMLVSNHSDGAYVVLDLQSDSPGQIEQLKVDYSLFFEVDPTHRGLVLLRNGDSELTRVICYNDPPLEIMTAETGFAQTLKHYIREGVWHIWIGYDHILFLVSLLLPAVLIGFGEPTESGKRWEPVEKFNPAFRNILKIVTVFTIAHSITLWLAVMGYVSLPSWIVEAVIAFSIVVTACNNLYPILPIKGWAFAFVFGLVHGFGFANVLVDLGLSSMTLGVSLLGFNIGVELGQLAIVVVVMPLIWSIRNTQTYRYGVFCAGSLLIAVLAGIWTIERVSDVVILPIG
ncbi:HupE/UreJ family protein [Mariniblastus fucicola]|uniref:HupE / UreJ protein n=1 Tax=Mariniblastus fucicola TaxID=980251 RepID=A0A5B9PL64_9BACT|nr:HupE/UreJ family protein [Mariniblastus fucicola]QEG23421.1 hypothetical protein MFFC18_33200 [Mariniblastus fucicola]